MKNWYKEYAKTLNKKLPQVVSNNWIDLASKEDMFNLWGFCWCDLTNHDLSQLDAKHLRKITFNSSTKWPNQNKMPSNFNPKSILEKGKNPMLEISELHKLGITGKGITVAVIDSLPYLKNIEIKKQNIEIINLFNITQHHFHGDCAIANLCGKNIGIAPDVRVLHYCQPNAINNDINKVQIKTYKDILQRIKNGEKIKIISRSGPVFYNDITYPDQQKDKKEIEKIITQIESYGCKILDSTEFGKNFNCGHYCFDDNTNINNLKRASWLTKKDDDFFKSKILFICGGKCVPQFDKLHGYKYEQIGRAHV